MSIALGRAGFGLETFTPRERVHSGDGGCRTDGMAHVLGALELANFLSRTLGPPLKIREQRNDAGCAHALDQIRGQTGVIYFNNCFVRAGATTRSGDHIDLFDGQRYYNDINRAEAGGDERQGGEGRLFRRADAVWFWRLS